MDGYDNFQQSVTIEGGQTSNVVGNLSSPRAELDIVTTPPGVEVLIDGKSYGPSPVRATLAPGNHTYTVKQPGRRLMRIPSRSRAGKSSPRMLTLAGGDHRDCGSPDHSARRHGAGGWGTRRWADSHIFSLVRGDSYAGHIAVRISARSGGKLRSQKTTTAPVNVNLTSQ